MSLSLYLNKYKAFTFARLLPPIICSHRIDINSIPHICDYFIDLGLKLCYNLDPKPHLSIFAVFKTHRFFGTYEVSKKVSAQYVF